MTKPAPNLVGDSNYKSPKEYPQKTKGMSTFACLLSTFVYISVFYIFNLSPSTLFSTTKFWFFITNTLILIIAADYGAFSSSKEKQDLNYEEYMMHSQVKINVSSFVSQYPEVVKETTPRRELDDLQEKKVITQESDLFPETNSQVVTNSDSEKHIHREDYWQEKRQVLTPQADKIHARTYRQVKSEKARRVVIDESKNIRRKSETEKNEPSVEENEFSTMSDEELNRRVEEFIERFNRQIRLQATRK